MCYNRRLNDNIFCNIRMQTEPGRSTRPGIALCRRRMGNCHSAAKRRRMLSGERSRYYRSESLLRHGKGPARLRQENRPAPPPLSRLRNTSDGLPPGCETHTAASRAKSPSRLRSTGKPSTFKSVSKSTRRLLGEVRVLHRSVFQRCAGIRAFR